MLSTGQTLASKYRVLGSLGQGGMGEVALAEHLVTGRRVAVKVILGAADGPTAARFDRETRAMAAIESPHIVGVLDAGIDEATGQRFLAMEYLRGRDLATTLAKQGPLSSSLVARIARQACLGLDRAHAAGVVHRDVKSANVFLSEQGGEVTVKLLDFGIAKAAVDGAASHALTRTGHLVGSPLYMSPEQASGDVTLDGRSDLFSLGVVMFELLTGAAPHSGITSFPKLLLAVSHTPAPRLEDVQPSVDPRLARVVARALELDRDKRWPSAAEMQEALSEIVAGDGRIHALELGMTLEEVAQTRVSVPPVSSFATTELATASTTAASVRRPTLPPETPPPSRWPLFAGIAIAGAAAAWSLTRGAPPDPHDGATPSARALPAAGAPSAPAAPASSAPISSAREPASSAPSPAPTDATAASAGRQGARAAARASTLPTTSAPAVAAPPPAPAKTRVDATSGFE